MSYQEAPAPTEHELSTSVLVVGAGWTGLRTAALLADLGYEAVLLDQDSRIPAGRPAVRLFEDLEGDLADELQATADHVQSQERIECLPGSRLINVRGMPGSFTASIRADGTLLERLVGSVVLATDLAVRPLFAEYGLEPGEGIVSQSQLESMLKGPDAEGPLKPGATVAFVVGFAQEGNPLTMQRVMQSVDALEDLGCRVFVYVQNIKVAAQGLERLYRRNRDQGAIYFKLREQPRISKEDGSISSFDPVLEQDVHLTPDLIVVEEALESNPINPELAGMLRLDLGPWSFLQENNVHRFPVRSNREGVFVAGEARDTLDLSGIWTDAANTALQVRELLGEGKALLPEHKGIVDKEKCCFCLTCFRCCPHGAINWEDKPFIDPLACQACGICASECPQGAIQIVELTQDAMQARIAEAVQAIEGLQEPAILAFCCQNSAYEAWDMAKRFERPLPKGLQAVKVPCAGKIDLQAIYAAFLQGADAVAVLPCHPHNCRSVRGNAFADWRVRQARRMLQGAGLAPERLLYQTLASNMDHDLSAALLDLEKQAAALGPTPLRATA